MGLGRGFTAVARRVPRLAGLVWFSCQLNRKDRRRAMGPPAHNKCRRDSKFTLAFWVAKLSKPCRSIPTGAICVWIESTEEEKISLLSCAAKLSKLQCNTPIYIG